MLTVNHTTVINENVLKRRYRNSCALLVNNESKKMRVKICTNIHHNFPKIIYVIRFEGNNLTVVQKMGNIQDRTNLGTEKSNRYKTIAINYIHKGMQTTVMHMSTHMLVCVYVCVYMRAFLSITYFCFMVT